MVRALLLRASSLAWLASAALAGLACSRAPRDAPISFIEDDYPRALAAARARHVPLFVDAWAPWCHTCLSLRAYVFPAPSLRRFSSRFVWLSLDTERADNDPVATRLGVRELPTLFVLDPTTEAPVVARPGSLTVAELANFLDDASRSAQRGGADVDFHRAERAGAEGRADEAIGAYRAALAEAPADWPGRPEATDALVTQLRLAKRAGECAATASSTMATLPPGTARADVVRGGIACAGEPAGADGGAPARGELEALCAFGERLAGDASDPILADDRSDLFDFVFGGYETLDRTQDAHRVAEAWARFLDGEAARAASPAQRAVFDAHRVSAYIALGAPERALPMLEQSARDFPHDYNPSARMGRALLALGRPADAIVALDRALGLAYGPRKLTLWSMEADAYLSKGDRAGARRALTAALVFADSAPLGPGYVKLRAALAKRLADLPP